MTDHPLAWIAPPPLWPAATSGAVGRPSILRFASDDFMQQLLATLGEEPRRLQAFAAVPETWRGPAPTPEPPARPAIPLSPAAQRLKRLVGLRRTQVAAVPPTSAPARPLKLYQPVHQRHYLVAASLVCAIPGMPDRRIDAGRAERAGFVLRRLMPDDNGKEPDPKKPLPALDKTWREHAFVVPPRGAPGWQPVADPGGGLAADEEVLPLFPLVYEEDDARRRRLLAGMIPTGRRDAYMAAPRHAATDGGSGADAAQPGPRPRTGRLVLLHGQVVEPWRRLIELAAQTEARLQQAEAAASDEEKPKVRDANEAQRWTLRDQIQTGAWYILLDLADFLDEHLPAVMAAVTSPVTPPAGLAAAAQALYDGLGAVTIPDQLAATVATGDYGPGDVRRTLRDALAEIAGGRPRNPATAKAIRDGLEGVTGTFRREDRAPGWPGFLFPTAELLAEAGVQPRFPTGVPSLGEADGVDGWLLQGEAEDRQDQHDGLNALVALIVRALPLAAPGPEPALPLAAQRPVEARGDGWFVIRCVLERSGCGPLHPPTLSDRTEPFQIAGFFDPDAPARPIRIGLPVDVSPAGLRKFDKNTVFMISDALCGQIHRVRSMGLGDLVRSVLPWPLHKDLPSGGGEPCAAKDDPGLSLGLMCSMSIPIITLCALILLIVMVSLLDIVFRWLPYFMLCFPLPSLKSKEPR